MDLVESKVGEMKKFFEGWDKRIRDVASKEEQEIEGRKGEFAAASEDIKKIKDLLSRALIDSRLGRIQEEEVAKLQDRLHRAEDIVNFPSLFSEGLKLERARWDAERGKFGLFEQHILQRYRDLKDEISRKGLSPDRTQALQRQAREVGREFGPEIATKDCEDFLKQHGLSRT